MAYVVREDVGTTSRRSLSAHSRLKVWEQAAGICVICSRPIDGVRDRWIVEHIRALELGGRDEFDNMGPAHEGCAREKTRGDHAAAAQAKRRKIRHLGADDIVRSLPGSRKGGLKRKVDGTVVRRDDSPKMADKAVGRPGNDRDSLRESVYRSSVIRTVTHQHQSHLLAPRTENSEDSRMNTQISSSPKGVSCVGNASGAESLTYDEIQTIRPAYLDFVFEGRPLLSDESAERYDALRQSLVDDLKPRDMVEAIWTRDIIDFLWEARRLRRWRALILEQADLRAVEDLIVPELRQSDPMALLSLGGPSANALAVSWRSSEGAERARVEQILKDRGLTAEGIRAHGFLLTLPSIERIDRMAMNVDQRRDALLREIERRRATFARHARAVTEVIDAENWPSETSVDGGRNHDL